MDAYWSKVADILAGADVIRARGAAYLPCSEREHPDDYAVRLAAAPWRPEFADALRALTSKPFGKDVRLKGVVSDEIAGALDAETKARHGGLVDDVDGLSSNLTTFSREWFSYGLSRAIHFVLIDYPEMGPNPTRADEKALGARPYWLHIPAERVVALYTETIGGREVVTHFRYRETVVVQDGFGERSVDRIRLYEPGIWEVWERNGTDWAIADNGTFSRGPNALKSVPLVIYRTGTRLGALETIPPLADLVDMQLELYRALARQDEILTFAGSPMLAANGMAKPPKNQEISVGPREVLFAPPAGEGVRAYWDYVQPAAANITEIRNHVAAVQADMRRVGMQPLLEGVGNSTATGQAIDAAKAHSSVKAWALLLNDAIEQAFVFTCEWMALDATVQTEVSTDFSIEPYAKAPLEALGVARAAGDLSQKTFWSQLQRFDVLPPDFDPEAEVKLLAAEPKPAVQEDIQIRQ